MAAGAKQYNYLSDEMPESTDFQIPENHNFILEPDELRHRMGKAAWEYESANRELRQLEQTKNIRERKLRIILLSKQFQYITNVKLKNHLNECPEDLKFKWTEKSLDAAIFIEQEELLSRYERYEKIASQAEKEFGMWQSQLMWYQSKMKHDRAEKIGDLV